MTDVAKNPERKTPQMLQIMVRLKRFSTQKAGEDVY